MKKIVFILVMTFCLQVTYCQENKFLNLGFEKIKNGKPVGCYFDSNEAYTASLDSVIVKEGRYSAVLEYKSGKPNFIPISYSLPNNYEGIKITLSGYLKTENVSEGWAGLWMRIDPGVAFDNMQNRGVVGTTDWKACEISLNMDPAKTKQIVFGVLLSGKGKVWVDNLKITIDGKDISEAKSIVKIKKPADSDVEFDNGSGVSPFTPDKTKIQNLKVLGLVWGFLKYYHPAIAEGKFNWDYELFRIVPSILAANSQKERDKFLLGWINKLGSFESSNEVQQKVNDIKMEPDLDWIANSGFSNELSAALDKIKNAKRSKENYYVDLFPNVGNVNFQNERSYDKMNYQDPGFRILALFRYWNMIQYFYPYKYLIGEDWKNVLEEFIPKFINANDETSYTLSMLEIIARIHDTHATISSNKVLDTFWGNNRSAIKISFVENKAVVTGYLDKKQGEASGLKPGDIISKINGIDIDQLVNERLKLTPASNFPTQQRVLARNLLRSNDSTIKLEIIRQDKPEFKTLKLYSSSESGSFNSEVKDTAFKMLTKDIAYIHNGALKRSMIPDIWKAMEKSRGVIIDIRNYPSDFPIYDFGKHLVPDSTPFVKFTSGSITQPGIFTYGSTLNVGTYNPDYYKGKVVIIVNEETQSSAEFHAMAYRAAPKATVIGSTTAGADGNVSHIILPGKIYTMITGISVHYPDGKETQRVGIVPDIEVKRTINGIREGRDELLEKAIELINKE